MSEPFGHLVEGVCISMIENLHKWLITRLVLAWIVLSLLIGVLVNYFGNARLDNHVVNMAKTETASYRDAIVSYLKSPSQQSLAELNRRIQVEIEQDNLIAVEFYDAGSRKIAEAIKPSAREVEKKLPKHGTDFADKDGIICKKLMLDSDTYLRVFVPIMNGGGAKIGYLEGIYHAPRETISQIKQQIFWSLILVVLVIFATSLVLYPLIIRLNKRLLDYSRNLALTNIGMLKVLGSAIAKRDSDTNIHNYRVTLYSVRIGEKLGLANNQMKGLIKGAFLHDLGKIAISDAILLKPGKLTDEEFEVMKTHVRHGEDIIRNYDWLQDALDVVGGHHEKYDGSGYPNSLAQSNIPLNARIFAVADVFDALTSRRPYKEPFGYDVALEILRQSVGSHFDPDVARLFLDHAADMHAEICTDNEPLLHQKLELCIDQYFQ
ncbi:HD-GYP domain-containing protein [Geobacter pelophilus]|uniref:HD-GYP domain-containing protein n=1 Tax=Geoanaerobacter pelophilus TaxID=60036 RepID=A0AAW4L7G8_9BACT|nr:HD-GYP domain-containing protein [Geoanaerobacter pelophilus]MBT0664988.1 HD-GYP domain-containing protein [Geoanaerobacter pelophilus]